MIRCLKAMLNTNKQSFSQEPKFSSLCKKMAVSKQLGPIKVGHDADTLLIHLFGKRVGELGEREGIQWRDHSSTTMIYLMHT